MQDLNVITKLNNEAHERDIPNQQAKGLYVVAEYAGLNYVGYTTYTAEVDANAKACEIGNEPGKRARVFPPTTITKAIEQGPCSPSEDTVDLTGLANATLPIPTAVTDTISSGGGGSFAGGGAESSWSDSSSSDSSVSSSD